MAHVRFYVELPGIDEKVIDPTGEVIQREVEPGGLVTTPSFDLRYVLLLESPSREGLYKQIDKIQIDTTSKFIESEKAEDPGNWFRIQFEAADYRLSQQSDPLIAEDILDLIDMVRRELKDMGDPPAFGDEHYMMKLRSAVWRHRGEQNLSLVGEYEWEVILLLVKAGMARDLAKDTSRYHTLSLPGGLTLSKGEISRHYLDVAEAYEKAYSAARKDINELHALKSSIRVATVLKNDMYTGLTVRELTPAVRQWRRIN